MLSNTALCLNMTYLLCWTQYFHHFGKYKRNMTLSLSSVLWRIEDPFTVWYHLEVLWKLTESRTQQREESGLWVEAKVGRVWAEGRDVSRQRRRAGHVRKKLSRAKGPRRHKAEGGLTRTKTCIREHTGCKVKLGKEGERIWRFLPLAEDEQLIHWNHGFFIFKDRISSQPSTTPGHSSS